MVQLRHMVTGALVSVTDEKAARLGPEWVPVVEPTPATPQKPAPRKRPTKKSSDAKE